MCQGCYSSWSLLNGRCPLDSPDLAEPARAHQSRVWPCIPDEVWINELWTSNSRITPHKSSNPARWNLQRTKKKKFAGNININLATHPSLNIVTRTGSSSSSSRRRRRRRGRIFQKPPIIWCVGEHNELGRMPNSILYQTNKNFWRDVSAFQRDCTPTNCHKRFLVLSARRLI